MTKWKSILAALKGGSWVGIVNTVLGLAVTGGLLTSSQSGSLATLVAGIATFLTLIASTIHTFHAAKLVRTNAMLTAKLEPTKPSWPDSSDPFADPPAAPPAL